MSPIKVYRFKLSAGFSFALCLLAAVGCSAPISQLEPSVQAPARALTDSPPDLPRMTGVNWFGFETGTYLPHGLWARDYRSMLQQMKDLGFNTIRLPFSNEMLEKTPSNGLQVNPWGNDPYTGVKGINVDLAGLSSLQIMDKIIDYAGILGLRIVLDNHSREADGYYNQTLWYTANVSEAKWIADWVMLAIRYKDKAHVVAYDLSNEPHGGYIVPGMSPAATWGFDLPGVAGSTNWKAAAERCAAAIMAVNPTVIFIIQGVQDYEGTNYWWGSNLRGVKTSPVTGIPKNRLMYSVHEYGPEVHSQDWFTDPTFPANLPAVWRDAFYFVYEQNLAGLYIGEIGIKEESAGDQGSIPYQWYTSFLQFAGKKVHFTYWSWNPNSGDTGGILKDDWLTVNPVKYRLLQPYLEPIGALPTPSPTPTQTPMPTPAPATPTPSPTPTPPSSPPAQLALEYATMGSQALTNTLALKIRVTNAGAAVDLAALKIFYFYTSEPAASNSMICDYAGGPIGGTYQSVTAQVGGAISVLTNPAVGADRRLEIGFATGSLVLAPGGNIEIQLRIINQQWGNFSQADDYSFIPTATTFTSNGKLVLMRGTEVVSGIAP